MSTTLELNDLSPFNAPTRAVIPATAAKVDGLRDLTISLRPLMFFSACDAESPASLDFLLKISRSPDALTTPLESISRTNLLMSALHHSPCPLILHHHALP